MAAPPHQPRYDLEDPGFPRSAREARQAARNGNGNGASPRYRRTQSPEQLDDYRFAGEDDMRSPTSDVALQDAMLAQAQQQQQRVVPVGQVGRNGGQRRQPPGPNNMNGPSGRGGPPSYPGGPMENGPQQHGPREGGRYRRQTRRPSDSEQSRPGGVSPPGSSNSQQNRISQSMASEQHHQQRRGPSPDRLAVPGADINRLNSPSIQKIVLQPLEQKIQEYDHLMHEAQSQMSQLDEEIRLLQERRRQAEERFMEAKSKHDEYERQHQDVGKALRGEVAREIPPPVRPIARMESVESFEPRPMSEQSSFHHKPKARGMLRMSLFNKSS
ncbi:hypothetical protein FALBO_15909 [Fusarium albosuccineum]|uniref:Uncharacterized protein n=1 Tax=Fusarium albosuccineum TaxID=1237068 RepID=A0A8H4KPC2_9HYPO|nr:hypothetical protein FALBO_15909 [Fusarium albosuccineum]